MDQRPRNRVIGRTRIPSQGPPRRPEQTTLSRTQTGSTRQEAASYGDSEELLALEGVYIISVAARLLEMHPQTLRKYERLGLVNPVRTIGMLRLYSREDLRKVRLIRQLGEMGLNLAGVEFALKTVDHLLELKDRLTAMVEDGPSKNLIQREIDRVFESLNLPTDD